MTKKVLLWPFFCHFCAYCAFSWQKQICLPRLPESPLVLECRNRGSSYLCAYNLEFSPKPYPLSPKSYFPFFPLTFFFFSVIFTP